VTLRATAARECVTLPASQPEAVSPARFAGAASPPPSRGCSTTHLWGHRVGSAPRAVARPPTGDAERGSRRALHRSAGEAEVDVSLPTSDRGIGSVRPPVLDPGPMVRHARRAEALTPRTWSHATGETVVPCCWRATGAEMVTKWSPHKPMVTTEGQDRDAGTRPDLRFHTIQTDGTTLSSWCHPVSILVLDATPRRGLGTTPPGRPPRQWLSKCHGSGSSAPSSLRPRASVLRCP
jgi:hypothetical protein